MPYYNLRRVSDDSVMSAAYPNDEAALREFGEELSFTGEGQPDYLMGRRDEPVAWVKTDIPVYSAG